jgi:hypothetical protein
MARQPVYCSVGFLSALYAYVDRPLVDWLEDDESDNVKKLYKLIHKEAEILLDAPISEFVSSSSPKYNPHFKKLLKQGNVPAIVSEDFEKINTGDEVFFSKQLSPSALLFTNQSEADAERLEQNFGVMVFTPSEISKTGFLFQNHLELFVKGKKKTWDFIKSFQHPFNAMVISDAYLLAKPGSRKNLEALLLNWLPKKLSIPFDLTIISDRDSKTGLPSDIDKIKNELTTMLEQHFPYKVNVTIIIAKIHDRNLITNYLWCSSGHGFELIDNGQSCRDTHMAIVPVTHIASDKCSYKSKSSEAVNTNSAIDLYTSLRDQFKNVNSRTPHSIGLFSYSAGSKRNRLFVNGENDGMD